MALSKEKIIMVMTFLVTLFTGVCMGVLAPMMWKEHKKAEKKYWAGLEKYAVKNK